MNNDTKTVSIDDWTLRTRTPQGSGPFPLFLLLHGWTGDENSMWIFASRLPQGCMMIAPRGPHAAPNGGYAWYPHRQSWPEMEDFRPAVDRLAAVAHPGRTFPAWIGVQCTCWVSARGRHWPALMPC